MDVLHFSQKQLAQRWSICETTLERWRSIGIGPPYLKLPGQVRYRLKDIEAFEESCLRSSTSTAIRSAGIAEFCLVFFYGWFLWKARLPQWTS